MIAHQTDRGLVIWLTGLSGAGKSSLAIAVNNELQTHGIQSMVLDGDQLRIGLCADLGFSAQDKSENLRRAAEVAKLVTKSGVVVLAAFISPYKRDRNMVREILHDQNFIEIYCNANLEICELRDVKGLYKRARSGELVDFTGISSPFEAPIDSEINLDTGAEVAIDCVNKVMDYLRNNNFLTL